MIKKALVCFLSVIIIGGMVFISIPSYAYAPNGVDLVPVDLTNAHILAMFENGDVDVQLKFTSSVDMDFNVYDMANQAKSVVTVYGQGENLYFLNHAFLSNNDRIVFYGQYAFSQRAVNGELYYDYTINMPFEYYLGDSSFFFATYFSGNSTGDAPAFNLKLIDADNNNIISHTITDYRRVGFWGSSSSIIVPWQALYGYLPEGYTMATNTANQGLRDCYSNVTFTGLNTTVLAKDIKVSFHVSNTRAQGSGTGYDYFYCAPLIFMASFNTTVYVDPDIADTVEEYLDLIVNPSPEDEARIEELKDKFASTVEDLEDASDNLHKDMPDLPDVSELDEEVTDGMEQATENVMNSMLGIGVVNTILGATFIFAVIKILLYGSGPY